MSFNFANREVRDAYANGLAAIRFSNLSANAYPSNPYDFETELELFNAWELGFYDALEDKVYVMNLFPDDLTP